MIAKRHLPNAPIKEALIDLRVALPVNVDLGRLEAAHDQIKDRFPVKKTIHEGRFGVRFDFEQEAHHTTASEQRTLGFRYETADGNEILQFRINGFTFSQLASYKDWEGMQSIARTLWLTYLKAATPDLVTRVATRFINEIRIPLPLEDFEEYLTEPPRIPAQLPQALSSYLMRIVLPNPSLGAVAIITQAVERQAPAHVPVVLDIDTLINRDFEADDPAVWDRLDDLRHFKNDIFFESITEKTAELCR
jgi:uncharacterized protein (TIGR04255 family)